MTAHERFLTPKTRPYLQRSSDEFAVRQRFLIVCEGKETEANYFGRFRVPGLVIETVRVGRSTRNLVDVALVVREKGEYDQTWCVFDKDDFLDRDFNDAIAYAAKVGLRTATSNPAFELWYVLHFQLMQSAIPRKAYMKILTERLGHDYTKSSETIYDEIKPLQAGAMRNARNLLSQYDWRSPAKNDPSTTVHELVEALNTYSKPYR